MTWDGEWRAAAELPPLKGGEHFRGMSGTVMDFWQFAMPDLRMNNARGYFAEFLVSRALGINAVRVEWDAYDVLWDCGLREVRIEVKSSAYLQSWAQRRPSNISFGNLRSRRLDLETGYAADATYNADVYVFAWNTQENPDLYDPLDVAAWAFHVLPRSEIERLAYKSVGLATLDRISERIDFTSLHNAIASAAGLVDGDA